MIWSVVSSCSHGGFHPLEITPQSEFQASKVREAWDEYRALLDNEQQWREVPKGMAFTTYEAD